MLSCAILYSIFYFFINVFSHYNGYNFLAIYSKRCTVKEYDNPMIPLKYEEDRWDRWILYNLNLFEFHENLHFTLHAILFIKYLFNNEVSINKFI